jgi:hypothetical protein
LHAPLPRPLSERVAEGIEISNQSRGDHRSRER